jgi:methionyl-tRNA formyltransferase
VSRVAFLGTPPAAVPALQALHRSGLVATVVTRPDRPRGRSGKPRPSAVKAAALDLALDVSQPGSASDLHRLLSESPPVDLAVVVAYGMLVPPETLALPRRGFVNVHFSLLPRWRGAAPVQRAVLAGDGRTGVSIMQMDEGLDTGPVVGMRSTPIGPEETAGELTARLAAVGGSLLAAIVPALLEGAVVATAQPAEGVSLAPKVHPDDARLSFSEGPVAFCRRVRAMNPRPGAWAERDGERFRITRARPRGDAGDPGALSLVDARLRCGVEGGAVELIEVQPQGKRPMPGPDWARGRHGDLGTLS